MSLLIPVVGLATLVVGVSYVKAVWAERRRRSAIDHYVEQEMTKATSKKPPSSVGWGAGRH